jgi:hypothetical protein
MIEIEKRMKEVLKLQLWQALEQRQENDTMGSFLTLDMINNFSSQIILCQEQIFCTQEFENAILYQDLHTFSQKIENQVNTIVLWIREDQTISQNIRNTLGNLIIHLISQKEIAYSLSKIQNYNLNSFEWIANQKYSLSKETKENTLNNLNFTENEENKNPYPEFNFNITML